MKILVTGGAGYIGSVLVPRLVNLGHDVKVVDNYLYGQTSLVELIGKPNFELHVEDVRNRGIMRSLIKDSEVIIPLAAIVGAPACKKDPILATSVNKDSVLDLFELINADQRIIMPTTNSAYGKGGIDGLCDENSDLNPLSQYAQEKVFVETVFMHFLLKNITTLIIFVQKFKATKSAPDVTKYKKKS